MENGNWTILNANDLGLLQGRATDILAHNGIVEVCSYGGLSRLDYDNEIYQTWTSQNSDMTTDAVLTMARDNDNDLLYVGVGSGNEMQSFDGTNWSKLVDVKFSESSEFDASNQTLWVGGSSALFKVKAGVITKFDFNNTNIPSGDVLDLAVDSQGDVWLVVEDEGLLRFDGVSTFEIYTASNSDIHADNPSIIAISPDDQIWIGGGQYNALSSFDGTTFTHYLPFVSDLPSANIRQMKCDNTGALWMASAAGLVKFGFPPSSSTAIDIQEFLVYPNPVMDILTIRGPIEFSKIEIINSLGAVVKYGNNLDEMIDVSELGNGIYWIIIFDKDGTMIGQEMMIKRK